MPLIVDTGTYTGDAVNNRVITYNRFNDLGLSPDLAAGWACFIVRDQATGASGTNAFKTSAHDAAVDNSLRDMQTLTSVGSIHNVTSAGIEIGTDTAVNANGGTYRWWVIADGMGEPTDTMVLGNYTGTGASLSITGVGFAPDAVFTFRTDVTNNHRMAAGFQSVDAGADLTWAVLSNLPDDIDHITSLDADGFTLGATTNNSNDNGVEYGYMAFNRVANACEQDTYTGNDTDDRNIVHPTHPFLPQIVWHLADSTDTIEQKTDQYTGDLSQGLSTTVDGPTATRANAIQALNSNGFQVGDGTTNTNKNTTVYHYLSLKDNFSAGESFGGTPPRYVPFVRSPYRAGVLSKYQQYKSATDVTEQLRTARMI